MPRLTHTAALGLAGERTGAAAKLGERGASKVGLSLLANSHYVFFWVSGRAPGVRASRITEFFCFVLFLYGFRHEFYCFPLFFPIDSFFYTIFSSPVFFFFALFLSAGLLCISSFSLLFPSRQLPFGGQGNTIFPPVFFCAVPVPFLLYSSGYVLGSVVNRVLRSRYNRD